MIQIFVTWTANFIPMWLLEFVASMYAYKKDISRNKRILLLVSSALIATLINQLHIPVLNAATALALYIVIILLLYDIVWYNAILLSGIVWSISAFAETISSVLWTTMLGEKLTVEFFAEDFSMIVAQSFATLIVLIVFYIFRIVIQKRKDERKLPQNLAVVLFPIASALTAYYILSTVVDVFPRQYTIYIGVFLAVFLVAINIASLIGNENVRKRYILQNEIDAMRHQEDLTVGLLRQQEEHLKEMQTRTHDFKNHLLCLRALVRENDSTQYKSLQYIDELLETVEITKQFVDVKNEALRAILVNTVAACNNQGIKFCCRIDYSEFSFMSFSDISILFSNALNNAVEACALRNNDRVPCINFKVLRKDGMLFIQLSNTIYTNIKRKNGVMLSQKTQPENHGIGFKNMERVVQMHEGNITIDYDDSEFRLYINLPISSI